MGVPGTARNVITVGAYQSPWFFGLAGGDLASFSGRGPTVDGRIKTDICVARDGDRGSEKRKAQRLVLLRLLPQACVPHDGTSQAAPHVTGVVALMLQRNPNLTFDEIRKHIRDSAGPPRARSPYLTTTGATAS